MNPKEFNDSVKQGDFKGVYLFYGEERYLVRHYADTLVTALGEADNFDSNASVENIIMAADTLPFLTEHRVVRVQYSKLFASGRKADSETMAAYLPQVPDSSVLIFMEAEVDRRGKLYKRVAEMGGAIECETPSPQALTTWLGRLFREREKNIEPTAANLLLRYGAHNMTTLAQEAEKLSAYVGPSPHVTTQDVEAICFPTLQTRVFDLIGAMGKAQTSQAINMYHNMLQMKESPLMILSMIIRQFRIILMVKTAEAKGMPKPQMAKALGQRSFVIDEAQSQGRRFTLKKIIGAMEDCQDTDLKIKTGLIDAEIGVALLILQYGQQAV
ncbi:MAG: DNA polymerase III subunit delta [Defluviitaleaceae bacterium]|nr:DNA polymerase III subunit delta [Defluviitaleaceae bacterium]